MLFHNLLLLIPAALLTSATPADLHSLADAGPPPPLDSSPPGVLSSTVHEARDDSAASASPCSQWYLLYGEYGLTYTEVQWCVMQRGDQTVVTQEQRNPWYFLDGTWRRGESRKLTWQTVFTAGSSWHFDTGSNFNDGPVRKDIHTFETKIPPGIYKVGIQYRQVGPFWEEKTAIGAYLTFAIIVPSN